MASASTVAAMMMAAVMAVKHKFGLGMKDERAQKLIRHTSPADYYRHSTRPCGRHKKTNRLHLAKKHKVMRRRAV